MGRYNPDTHHRRSIRLQGYDYTQQGAYFVTICSHQREYLFGAIDNAIMSINLCGQMAVDCWNGIPVHFPHADIDAFVVMPNHMHGIVVIRDVVQSSNASSVGAQLSDNMSPSVRAQSSGNMSPSVRAQSSGNMSPSAGAQSSDNMPSSVRAQSSDNMPSSVRAQHAAPLQHDDHIPGGVTPNNVAAGSLGAIVRSFKSAAARRINQLRDTPGAPVWLRNYHEHIIRDEKSLNALREYIANNPAQWEQDKLYGTGDVNW